MRNFITIIAFDSFFIQNISKILQRKTTNLYKKNFYRHIKTNKSTNKNKQNLDLKYFRL